MFRNYGTTLIFPLHMKTLLKQIQDLSEQFAIPPSFATVTRKEKKLLRHDVMYLRHDGYSCSRSVHTPLCFCLRNTLNSMDTRLVFQFTVDTFSFDLHHIGFVSTFLSLKKDYGQSKWKKKKKVCMFLADTAATLLPTSELEMTETFQEFCSLYFWYIRTLALKKMCSIRVCSNVLVKLRGKKITECKYIDRTTIP